MSEVEQPKRQAPAAGCAADVLLVLARSQTPLSVLQIAERTGCTRSLVYRVLAELQERAMVRETGYMGTTAYGLGLGVLEVGGAYAGSVSFMESAQQTLRRIAQTTGESASLGVIRGTNVLYIAREEGHRSPFSIARVGKEIPAHATGLGKSMLAQLSDGEVRELYAKFKDPLPALTKHTIPSVRLLLADLAETRRRGYAIERGETVAGRCCIAVSVGVSDPSIQRIGLSVSCDETRFEEHFNDWVTLMLESKEKLSVEANGRRAFGDSYEASTAAAGVISALSR